MLLANLNLTAAILALGCAYLDVHLDLWVYAVVAGLQILSVVFHIVRWNLFSASVGGAIAALTLYGVLLQTSDRILFGPWYPSWLLTPDMVAESFAVLMFGGGLFFWVTFHSRRPGAWSKAPPAVGLDRHIRRLAVVLAGIGLVALALTTRPVTIFEAPYPFSKSQAEAIVVSSGLTFMGSAALGMSLAIAGAAFGTRSREYRALALAVLMATVWFFLVRGGRGHALPLMATLVLVPYYFSVGSHPVKLYRLGLGVLVIAALYQVLGTYRWSASVMGADRGLEYAWTRSMPAPLTGEDSKARSPGIMEVSTLPQSYWHILQVIDLYRRGNRLDGRSFVDVVKQAVPEFVSDLIGYRRPISESARLSMYRLHGGGMYAFATAYWNFGLEGVGLFAVLLGLLANWIESWFRRQSNLIIGAYFIATGLAPYGMLYGWQSLARGLEISIALALALALSAALVVGERRSSSGKSSPLAVSQ